MLDTPNHQVIQIISSAIGFFLTIMGAIARLNEFISKEHFVNVSFVALIFLIVIPFLIAYYIGQKEDETNENQPNQQEETATDYRGEEDTSYSC